MPAHSSEISQANAVRVSLAAVVGTLLALVGLAAHCLSWSTAGLTMKNTVTGF